MVYPKYSYPTGLFVRAFWDFLLMRRRDLQNDAKACIENMEADLMVWGKENIPQQGTCVLTINHYYRPVLARNGWRLPQLPWFL